MQKFKQSVLLLIIVFRITILDGTNVEKQADALNRCECMYPKLYPSRVSDVVSANPQFLHPLKTEVLLRPTGAAISKYCTFKPKSFQPW